MKTLRPFFTRVFVLSTWVAVLASHSALGQTDTSFTISEIVIGRSLGNEDEIYAKSINFNNEIVRFEIIGSGTLANMYLRKDAKHGSTYEDVISYDLSTDSILWFKKHDFRHTLYMSYDSIMLKSIANKTYRIDPYTGEVIWYKKGANFGVDSRFNLGYLYQYKKTNNVSEKLNGINLSNGVNLWERDIPHEYGWNDIEVFDDSIAIVTSDGLHSINLNTGKGWDLRARTGDNSNGSQAAAIVLTASFGVIGGVLGVGLVNANSYYVDLIQGPNYYGNYTTMKRDLCSNLLKIDNDIYFSDNSQIFKLNYHTGEIIWKKGYPYANWKAGTSKLLFLGGNLLSIDYGCATLMDQTVYYSVPVITSLDTANLNFNFETAFDFRKQHILDHQIIGDHIILLFSSHLVKLNLKNGEVIEKIDLEESFLHFNNEFQADVAFAKNQYVGKHEQSLDVASSLVNQELYIILENDIKFVLNPNTFSITENLSNIELYQSLALNNFKFAVSEKGSYLLSETLEPIAELELSENARLVQNTLFDFSGNQLIQIETSQFSSLLSAGK